MARREGLQQELGSLDAWLTKMQATLDSPRPTLLKQADVAGQLESLRKLQAEVKIREQDIERVNKESSDMASQVPDPSKDKLYNRLKGIAKLL